MADLVSIGTPGPLILLSQVPPFYRQHILEGDTHPSLGTPCWCWDDHLNRNGYPRRRGNKGPVLHRELWELMVGPIPEGHLLDHLCRMRRCMNLHHLEPVTVQVNTLRGKATLFLPQGSYTHEAVRARE